MMRNKKGNLMVGLLMLFMEITILIAIIPGLVEIIDVAQRSNSLNCVGYVDSADNDAYGYNSTLGTKSTIGCLAIKLYLPYIILGVLIVTITRLIYNRYMSPQQQEMGVGGYGGGY